MQQIFLLLILLACPISMFFMMRGMGHGKSGGHDMSAMDGNDDTKDRRLADLEREVADLRGSTNEQRFIESRKSR